MMRRNKIINRNIDKKNINMGEKRLIIINLYACVSKKRKKGCVSPSYIEVL